MNTNQDILEDRLEFHEFMNFFHEYQYQDVSMLSIMVADIAWRRRIVD